MARHSYEVARVDEEWRARRPVPLGDIGSTARLEILPLVDWHASRPDLATDMGVSYLIRTDTHTILFDTGMQSDPEGPNPLRHNLAALGVSLDAIAQGTR